MIHLNLQTLFLSNGYTINPFKLDVHSETTWLAPTSGTLSPGSQRHMEMSWKNTNICPESSSRGVEQRKLVIRFKITQ